MSKIMHMDTQYAGVTPEKDFSDLIDFFYPVGCYFETSDVDFNPNVSWSGYWELETEGQVHVSAGSTYEIGDTGGNKDAIIPYHNHTASGGSVTNCAAFWTDSSGSCSIGSGGAHTHTVKAGKLFASGSNKNGAESNGTSTASGMVISSGAHTHTVPNHQHSLPAHGHGFTQPSISYAGDSNNTVDANMQPYIVVNRWHRTA